MFAFVALEYEPIVQETKKYKEKFELRYALYKNPELYKNPYLYISPDHPGYEEAKHSTIFVFISSQQKKNLPENYMEHINHDGYQFTKKHCPNYPDLGFFERDIKTKEEYIIAIGLACYLE